MARRESDGIPIDIVSVVGKRYLKNVSYPEFDHLKGLIVLWQVSVRNLWTRT
jgi:hypothetical protein